MTAEKTPDLETRRRRLLFRAWHRGTKEADIMLGNFVKQNLEDFGPEDCVWLEALLEETEHDTIAWITGQLPWPEAYKGRLAEALMKLDYIPISH